VLLGRRHFGVVRRSSARWVEQAPKVEGGEGHRTGLYQVSFISGSRAADAAPALQSFKRRVFYLMFSTLI